MSDKITLLDYGMCNLLNVARAFEHIGANITIAESPEEALNANRLVVPGVGAFKDSMAEVQRRGFDDVIRNFIETERPFLGICVGMQMLFEGSEEFGNYQGLGILTGKVTKIPNTTTTNEPQRVPHIGWNHLVKPDSNLTWSNTLFKQFEDKSPAMYFVHSFAATPAEDADRLADCIYGGHRICAAVQRNNVMATQFHPERSGEIGLNLLETFMAYKN